LFLDELETAISVLESMMDFKCWNRIPGKSRIGCRGGSSRNDDIDWPVLAGARERSSQ
jgi:hypothetical protein